MNWRPLDRVDSGLYRGIAILMIVTHNFMHRFPSPGENEFDFSPDRFHSLINLLWNEPENIIRVTLSFFGHFGVQAFIFLSAYGLTKKHSLGNLNYWPFIFERILKIYPAFILSILAWAFVEGWLNDGLLGPLKLVYWQRESLILKLTLLSNFIPGKSISPVGPWWFIPFIFQFYFIFPFMLTMFSRWGWPILLQISVISILFSILCQGNIGNLNIYFTILGHLPELCLGIYMATSDDNGLQIPILLIFSAATIYILGNIFQIFWYANHISFLILLLVAFSYLTPRLKENDTISKGLLFFGSISMQLFLVNGFLRQPFISWAIEYNYWLLTIALCLLSLMSSVLVALALSKVQRHLILKVSSAKAL